MIYFGILQMAHITNGYPSNQQANTTRTIVQNNDESDFSLHSNYQSFRFPVELCKIQTLKGKHQFREVLKAQAMETQKDKNWHLQVYKINSNTVIKVKCKLCSAFLKYQMINELEWRLQEYTNIHVHPICPPNAFKKSLRSIILENIGDSNEVIFDKVAEAYKCSLAEVVNLKRQILGNYSPALVEQALRELEYEYRLQLSSNSHPRTLVAVSKMQKAKYRLYGEVLSYDITYNCIKQVSNQGKKYGIGIFSGFDNNNRLLIFGVSITASETAQDFKKVFSWFFDLMGYTRTTLIVTDQQHSIISALKQLKNEHHYKYIHGFDNFHFLRTFRKSLKEVDTQVCSAAYQCLRNSMKEVDANLGQMWLNKLRSIMAQNGLQEQYCQLQDKFESVLVWKMPNQYIGLSVHSNESVNELVKQRIAQQVRIVEFLQIFDRICRQRVRKCESQSEYELYPAQLLFKDAKIQEVRQKFERRIFNRFLERYRKANFCKIIGQQDNLIRIRNLHTDYLYEVYNLKCSCGTLDKVGIPCEHLICVVKARYAQLSYASLFNERWRPSEKIPTKKSIKRLFHKLRKSKSLRLRK